MCRNVHGGMDFKAPNLALCVAGLALQPGGAGAEACGPAIQGAAGACEV